MNISEEQLADFPKNLLYVIRETQEKLPEFFITIDESSEDQSDQD